MTQVVFYGHLSPSSTTGRFNHHNSMAKPTTKTKSAPKKAAPVLDDWPSATTRNRETVLVKKTAAELHDLIGDTPIGVSRKELLDIQMKQERAKLSAALG